MLKYFKPKRKEEQKKKRGRPPKRTRKKKQHCEEPPTPPPHLRKTPPELIVPISDKTKATPKTAIPVCDTNGDTQPAAKKRPAASVPPAPAPARKKAPRINWGKGVHRDIMEKALRDWFNKTGYVFDDNGEAIDSWKVYANKVGIPHNTFFKYIHPDLGKRRTLGDGSRGKKKLLSDSDVKLAGAVFARADRGNDGMSRKEATDMIQDLNPDISRKAAARQLSRVVLPRNAAVGILKKSTQKVQATTSDRTNINIAQQFRWHRLIDKEYEHLREVNTGRCRKTNKLFGEVMHHFIIGLDEMCIMSDAHGDLRVVACAQKKKHEKLLQDCRVSITMVRTGTTGGTTGPTIFILKGAKRRKEFTNKFLLKYGCAVGSTIIMTENAYMTDEAWLKAAKAIVRGYRELPYVKENAHWLVLELLDGFKSHENVLAAHRLRYENNIRSIKEESNSSHANQGYDQETAKTDKKNAAESLYDQRKVKKMQTGKTHIDQYDLVLTGIRIVNACTSDIWECSYRRVNLDPRERVCFQEWCKKIKHFLVAGEAFKEEDADYSPQEMFNMLPSFWHGMEPAERRVVMTILQSNNFQYTAETLRRLNIECNLPFSQLSDIRVCVIIARQHPGTLDMSVSKVKETGERPEDVQEAMTGAAKQSDGLDDFQLVPKDARGNPKLKGIELLDHMCRLRNRRSVEEGNDRVEPTSGLDISLQPDSLQMIQPTIEEMRHGNILRDHYGERAKRKCAQRKLNNIGLVVGQSTVVNSVENMKRMEEDLQFATACAEISRIEQIGKEEEQKKKTKEFEANAPDAAKKLGKNPSSVGKLTKNEIEAILYTVYNVTVSGTKSKLRKADYVKALEKELDANWGKYEDYFSKLEVDTPPN